MAQVEFSGVALKRHSLALWLLGYRLLLVPAPCQAVDPTPLSFGGNANYPPITYTEAGVP